MGFLWPLYSFCPSFCKIFCCLLWTSYSLYKGFLFFHILWIFGLLVALSAAVSLSAELLFWHLSVYVWKIFISLLLRFLLSEPVPVSAYIGISFLQLLICLCILIFQNFSFLLFVHRLLSRFIVSAIIVATSSLRLLYLILYYYYYYYYYIFLKNALHFCVYHIQPQSFTLSPYCIC